MQNHFYALMKGEVLIQPFIDERNAQNELRKRITNTKHSKEYIDSLSIQKIYFIDI